MGWTATSTPRIGSQAYRVALPEKYAQLHDVFPIQLLEKHNPREDEDPLPLPDLEDDQEWDVEEVKDKRTINKKTHYLVKWDGWPVEYNQWVPEEDMTGAMEAVRKYEKAAKRKSKKRNRDSSDTEEAVCCSRRWIIGGRASVSILRSTGSVPS